MIEQYAIVLYAPTFRKHASDPQWHWRYIEALYRSLPERTLLVVSGHPLDSMPAPDRGDETHRLRFLRSCASVDALPFADYVITDYSAVAFEAMLAGRKTLFYVPDIDVYRGSPGLNLDPMVRLKPFSFRSAASLGKFLESDMREERYDRTALRRFMDDYGITSIAGEPGTACERIVAALRQLLPNDTDE